MSDPNASGEFRKQATTAFKSFVAILCVVALGLVALGWWIGHLWGLAIGIVVALIILFAGLTMGGFLYAMSQDGA